MIVAAALLVVGVGSLPLIIRELRKAPEGYEDEYGFYTVRKRAVEYGAADRIRYCEGDMILSPGSELISDEADFAEPTKSFLLT